MPEPLQRGVVVWVNLDPTRRREQAGTRPAVVISSSGYLVNVADLVIVIPVTSRDRHWPHHVPLAGRQLTLDRPSFAMTEQPCTTTRARITGQAGRVGQSSMTEIDQWLKDFTDL